MKLRNFILTLTLVLTSLVSTAQTYRNFVDFNDGMSEGFLKGLADGNLGWTLQEWGWLKNGHLTDAHDMNGSGEIWTLRGNRMLNFNTYDGSFIYDTHIADGRVYLKKQRKMQDNNPGNFMITNPNYNGWLRILGLNKENEMLTLDNFGVYRIFSFFKNSASE